MQTIRMRRRFQAGTAGSKSGPRASGGSAGFSIVEVMVAVAVLVLAIVGIVGSMLSAMALNRVNRETAIAQQAARRAIEEVSGIPFRETFAIYNANVGDDGGMSVPERGPDFVVAGLQPQVGDPDGMCGRIMFPVVVDLAGNEELREDVFDVGWSMPRNLDNNLTWPDTDDKAGTYIILPVRVRVEWVGVTGNRAIELETMLSWR